MLNNPTNSAAAAAQKARGNYERKQHINDVIQSARFISHTHKEKTPPCLCIFVLSHDMIIKNKKKRKRNEKGKLLWENVTFISKNRKNKAQHQPETMSASFGPTVCMFPMFSSSRRRCLWCVYFMMILWFNLLIFERIQIVCKCAIFFFFNNSLFFYFTSPEFSPHTNWIMKQTEKKHFPLYFGWHNCGGTLCVNGGRCQISIHFCGIDFSYQKYAAMLFSQICSAIQQN